MKKQMSVSLADFRYVCIECPRCKTRVILDMKERRQFAKDNNYFTPVDCAGCKTRYDSAIPTNIDRLQQAYEGLAAGLVTFLGESEEE